MKMLRAFVYIMSNRSMTLYTGVTNDIARRVAEHKQQIDPKCFTARYHCNELVFVESFPDIKQAIAAEKKIKGWTRRKKIELIREQNPDWRDLSSDDQDLRG